MSKIRVHLKDYNMKEFENAVASNNERGELIISVNIGGGSTPKKVGPLAVFKDWLYWEIVD